MKVFFFTQVLNNLYEITNGVSNYFVNGHFKLSNIFFKFVPEKYLCVTVLRDPMERFMSNFFFQTQNPFTPYHASINNGEMDFLDFLSANAEIILVYSTLILIPVTI